MGILVVFGVFVLLSVLGIAGKVADSRRDTGRYDWAVPTNPGRGDPSPGW